MAQIKKMFKDSCSMGWVTNHSCEDLTEMTPRGNPIKWMDVCGVLDKEGDVSPCKLGRSQANMNLWWLSL